MPIKTKQWDDPREPDDGFRLLICRYRPRALPKAKETWDHWEKNLGPSRELHARYYGKPGYEPVNWPDYRRIYLQEMAAQKELIEELARRVAAGEMITLLCSSMCDREDRCHRSLLRGLIEEAMAGASGAC